MRAAFCVAAAAAAALLAAAPAVAQSADAGAWHYGTTLTPGVASASSEAGATLGGAIGWELTPRLGVDGAGTWLNRPESSEAFAAAIRARYALVPRASAPFVEGGFGMYRTAIDPSGGPLPEFYRTRMAGRDPARRQTFTDPAFFVGGGWTVFVSRHISLRPAVESTIVTRDGHAFSLTGATVRVGYHFEHHPVTP